MRKRRLALLLTLAMIISMFPINAFATEFSDMPNDWSTRALENAVANGLLKGDNGKIMPNDNLTRAQMATIVNRAFGTTEKSSIDDFTDVTKDFWYYDEMSKSVQMKTFIGSGDKLYPDSNITREEAFVVLARAFKISGASENVLDKFSDRNDISDWARDGVSSLVDEGYIAGSNGQINPKQNITRAEFAQMMDNLLKNYISKEGTYTEDYSGNLMINVPNVTLKGLTITGDLIIGDGVGDGEVTLDAVTVTGRVLVRGGGENSIKITGNSNIQNITIARVDGIVRVYAEDGTEIGEVIADGNDDVIIEGNFGTVTIVGTDIAVTATNATIESASIAGENSNIIIDENSSVKTINVNANNVKISGDGTVESVTANANNVTVTTPNTTVTAGEGTEGVTAGEKPVESGETVTVEKEEDTTGDGGGGRDTSPSKGEVSAISVTPTTMELTVRETGTIKETVTGNATNKSVTWSSSKESVATVDDNGKVTAVAEGTATITATAVADVTKKATCVVTVKATAPVVDTTEYDAIVASVPADNSVGTYMAESWTAFLIAIDKCNLTLTAKDGQAALDAEVTLIQEALDLLVEVTIDLIAYEAALAAVEEADYTADSWAAYQAVVAKNVVTTENNQAEVDAATAAITAAQENLVTLEAAALAAINAYFTSESYKYADAPSILEEHLAALGMDVGEYSDYKALDERDVGGKERLTAVMYDLMHNKPEGGYNQATLTTYFNEIVETRGLTQESMNMVLAAKEANSIETLKDLEFVTILLNRFKDETLSYTKHSNKPFSEKVAELQPIVEKYNGLDTAQKEAALAELLEKVVNRSQDTIDEFAAILDVIQAEIAVAPVEVLITALPEVTTEGAPTVPDVVNKTRTAMEKDDELWKLDEIYNYLGYLENADAVAEAKEAFDTLDLSSQGRVDADLKTKLNSAVAKLAELKSFVESNTTIGVGTYDEGYSNLAEQGAKGRIQVTAIWPFYPADGFNTVEGMTSLEMFLNNDGGEIVKNIANFDIFTFSKDGNWPTRTSGSFDLGIARSSSSGSWTNGLYELKGDTVTQADLPDKVVVEFTYKGVLFTIEKEVKFTPEMFIVESVDPEITDFTFTVTAGLQEGNENTAIGQVAGTVGTEVGGTSPFTYALVAGDGSDDNANFEFDGTDLKIKDNALAVKTYKVRIEVTDSKGKKFEKAVTIAAATAPPTYAVSLDITIVEGDDESTIFISPIQAEAGAEVTLTVSPKNGMRLKDGTLKAKYNDGTEQTVSMRGSGVPYYYFDMPAYDVVVTAEFETNDALLLSVASQNATPLTGTGVSEVYPLTCYISIENTVETLTTSDIAVSDGANFIMYSDQFKTVITEQTLSPGGYTWVYIRVYSETSWTYYAVRVYRPAE